MIWGSHGLGKFTVGSQKLEVQECIGSARPDHFGVPMEAGGASGKWANCEGPVKKSTYRAVPIATATGLADDKDSPPANRSYERTSRRCWRRTASGSAGVLDCSGHLADGSALHGAMRKSLCDRRPVTSAETK